MTVYFAAKSTNPRTEKEARICNTVLLHLARVVCKSMNHQMFAMTVESVKGCTMCEFFHSLLFISEST